MNFLPIFINIRGRNCLVVGAGDVAARKARLLLDAGARVSVIAPEACAAIQKLNTDEELSYQQQAFSPNQLSGNELVIAATNDQTINQKVSTAAREQHLPVNVVDQPELCSFIMPSIVDRSPVLVAVSTGGASPVLARLLRGKLETMIPAAYGQLAELVAGFRQQVNQQFRTSNDRRRFWETVLDGPIAEMLFSGKNKAARASLEKAVSDADQEPHHTGEVYLVGAGPGDPDLLTFRALRLLQQSDVVLHDRLVSPEILAMARRDAEKIYVGKEKANHAVRQENINQLLVDFAKQGKRVCRLKGGDPFIFGRGGEEIADLAKQGIPFQIVPGVTAASGCAAYSGIPLTHRDYSQSCVFVAGHLRDGTIDLNWDMLCQPQQTVVVYMGLTGLETLCAQMVAHGTPPTTPAALIEQGTTRKQRVLTGTLETLPEIVLDADVHAPTLVVIGDVVQLHGQLNWFESDADSGNES
ncbi:MAG: siroheme synthase CysG [Gammaproteobacteria bacterium]|nr:siroheme synthase CysG [Gammaproteobacteria bacterium]